MASSLRAGHSLLRAVDAVSRTPRRRPRRSSPGSSTRPASGRDLGDSLDEVAERMGSEDFAWVAQAIAIHREVGGNLAEVLDAVGAHHPRAQRHPPPGQGAVGRGQAVGDRAAARCPSAIIGFISMTNPSYLHQFTESLVGYVMLAAAVVLMLVGGVLAQEDRDDQVLMTHVPRSRARRRSWPSSRAVPLIGWALLARPQTLAAQARDNLTRGIALPADRDRRPGPARLWVPGSSDGLTPGGTVAPARPPAGRAGRPAAWPVTRLVAAKLVLAAVAGGLGVLRGHRAPQSALTVLLVLAVTVVAYFVPELLLYSRGQERQAGDRPRARRHPRPDDHRGGGRAGLRVGHEPRRQERQGPAGRGAGAHRCRTSPSASPRREAYLALAERTGVPDLRRFIGAVVQADAYGVSIADVLRTQAAGDAAQAPSAGRGEGHADPGQGDLPADPLHPADAVHRAARPRRHGHDGGVQ